MIISQKSIDAIVYFEVSSPAVYVKSYQHPTWPGGASGITIGIGYDLGFNTKAQIAADWSKLPADTITALQSVAGLNNTKAHDALHSVSSLVIPLNIAEDVFLNKTLKRFAGQVESAYPSVDDLMPDAAGALLSLVFNRGANTDSSSDRRKEMFNIKALVVNKDYKGIAEQLRNMKRLWGKDAQGLLDRRDKEASMVENSIREYKHEELHTL